MAQCQTAAQLPQCQQSPAGPPAIPPVAAGSHQQSSSMYFRSGTVGVSEYAVVGTLGQGRFGEVFLVEHPQTAHRYAMKKVYKRGGGGKQGCNARSEAGLLFTLSHINVVRVFELVDDPESDCACLITEYVDGGAVLQLGRDGRAAEGPLKATLLRSYVQQIADGLQYMHDQNVVHRDICPGNILVSSSGVIKIADLGVGRLLSSPDDLSRETTGTPMFLSPEACRGEVASGKANDVWAFGVTAHIMLYGCCPFDGTQSELSLYRAIESAPIRFGPVPAEAGHEPGEVSQLLSLVERMLDRDPLSRITLNEVRDDPWVCGGLRIVAALDMLGIHASVEDCREQVPLTPISPPLCPTFAPALRVLVVDDVFMQQKLLGKIVSRVAATEVSITTVSDGEDAVAACEKAQFDVILMDVHMSQCNGIVATGRIRAHEAAGDLPCCNIIGVTGDPDQSVHSLCLDSGMQRVLQKPVTPATLRSIFEDIGIPVRGGSATSTDLGFKKGEIRGGAEHNAIIKSYQNRLSRLSLQSSERASSPRSPRCCTPTIFPDTPTGSDAARLLANFLSSGGPCAELWSTGSEGADGQQVLGTMTTEAPSEVSTASYVSSPQDISRTEPPEALACGHTERVADDGPWSDHALQHQPSALYANGPAPGGDEIIAGVSQGSVEQRSSSDLIAQAASHPAFTANPEVALAYAQASGGGGAVLALLRDGRLTIASSGARSAVLCRGTDAVDLAAGGPDASGARTHALDSGDQFVILASAELWEVIGVEEAVEMVLSAAAEIASQPDDAADRLGHSAVPEALADEAAERGASGSVSCVVIWFNAIQ
eukprot:TRINITY_DN863_c1_g1_i1.p1 TRINITY_DN863_c1_g1~~TRINITY_DN863_c1_g1_i1.p1  ORF type:complete len:826 (+),score=271.61 TRINITY_DN863_c1_g1_i1:102-2579(+)